MRQKSITQQKTGRATHHTESRQRPFGMRTNFASSGRMSYIGRITLVVLWVRNDVIID